MNKMGVSSHKGKYSGHLKFYRLHTNKNKYSKLYFTIVYYTSKLWYYGTLIYFGKLKYYGKGLWCFENNYGTILRTIDLRKKHGRLPKTKKLLFILEKNYRNTPKNVRPFAHIYPGL